jgi:uncharacterized circularly permuted ATP-grasp superfamily protein
MDIGANVEEAGVVVIGVEGACVIGANAVGAGVVEDRVVGAWVLSLMR